MEEWEDGDDRAWKGPIVLEECEAAWRFAQETFKGAADE
jgi:hypothetical protein